MIRKSVGQTAARRSLGLAAAVALAASLALATCASSALATPGEWTPFAQCPVKVTGVATCIIASTTSGEFVVGGKTVPIKHTITLQGGLRENEKAEIEFVGAANGETISKTPQTVPGGLIGIEGLGGEVSETTELAGPASGIHLSTENLLEEKGTALQLPVKVKLNNPILGNSCYLASNRHPMVLNLTTGTTSPPKPNKPIKGAAGEISFNEEFNIITIKGGSLVENSFAAPGVEGCGLIPFLTDPLVDLAMGVPASAGHNTAILNGEFKVASAEEVIAHGE